MRLCRSDPGGLTRLAANSIPRAGSCRASEPGQLSCRLRLGQRLENHRKGKFHALLADRGPITGQRFPPDNRHATDRVNYRGEEGATRDSVLLVRSRHSGGGYTEVRPEKARRPRRHCDGHLWVHWAAICQ